MSLTNVTILGAGVLGSQIAFQSAFHGKSVTSFDIDDEAIVQAEQRFDRLEEIYASELPGATAEQCAQARLLIRLTTDLADAVHDADLVIEAVPEDLDIKKQTYIKLAPLLPDRTIVATNSSTFLPSDMAESTGRPQQFVALHFANNIWRQNMAEIMGHDRTSDRVHAQLVEFAEEIGMVPIPLYKEKAGYLLNSLLVPFLSAGAELLVLGVADPETIDKTWRISTGSPAGPFQMFDVIGLNTAYNVAMSHGELGAFWADYLKTNYIDKGKLGVASGEGFYKY